MVATQISEGFFLSTASSFIPARNPDGVTDSRGEKQNVINERERTHTHWSNQHTLTVIKTRDCGSTYCVEALEQMFWGKLTSAVLYVHAPIELSVLAAYETHTQSGQLLMTVDRLHVCAHELKHTFRQQ